MRVDFHCHCVVSKPLYDWICHWTPLTVLDQPFEIATHAPDRPSEQDQHGRVSVSQPVHRDDLFDFCLFERWRQAITTDSSPVARFAKFVAEHQLEPALRTFVFPFPKSSHEFARDWNFSYPLLFNMLKLINFITIPFY